MKDKRNLILKDKNIMKGLILLSFPVMMSNILKSIHDLVDIYFIGNQALPKELLAYQVSSITLTSPIIQIAGAIATGLMIAGTSIMSKQIGENNSTKARRVSTELYILSFLLGVLVNAILYFGSSLFLKWMHILPENPIFMYAWQYLKYRSFECPFLFLFYAYIATKHASGDTITPVILNCISIVFNIILTWYLIQKQNRMVEGAALATVLANIIIIPLCLIPFSKKETTIKLEWKQLSLSRPIVKELFQKGFPASFSIMMTSFAFIIINRMITHFDASVIYAIGVVNRLNALLLLPTLSIGSVLTTFIGQNYGAKQYERMKKILVNAMLLTILITILLSISLFFTKDYLIRIFIQKDVDAKTFDLAKLFFTYLILGFVFMGCFEVWNGYFQGMGRTDVCLLLSIARLWILRLPILHIMMYKMSLGILSIYYSMLLSNGITCLLGIIFYPFTKTKQIKTKQQNVLRGGLKWQKTM